jgi:voltage-gated potassium channel
MLLVLEFGGMSMLAAESKSPDAIIKSASDSFWYICVTMTTVGYGERFPITNTGRIIGIVVLTTGIGLFGTLTGFLANAFLATPQPEEGVESSEPTLNREPQPSALPAKLVEIQELLAEQQRAQAALQNKIADLEQLLVQSNANMN